jgi:3-hydroxyisobutyrate dehydrogenase-like beta-hydroxyacid dehydrogenase
MMGSSQVIGWIGAGRMGVPMAGFILKAGYPVLVYSRSAAGRDKLIAQGARAAPSVAACAREADVVFSSIPDDSALREIALGPDGVLAAIGAGAIFVDTSTVSAEVSAEVGDEAMRRGVAYLRIPISAMPSPLGRATLRYSYRAGGRLEQRKTGPSDLQQGTDLFRRW